MDELPPIQETPPPSASLPEAPKPPHTSLAARLLNVFATPGEVFEEVKASGPSTANWLVPVLLSALVGIFAAIVIFSQPAIVQQIREQQTKGLDDRVKAGKMTREQADQAAAVTEKFVGPTTLKITGSIGAVFASFARVFWWALILWLLGLWFLKSKFSYLKAVEVAGLATMISVLGAIVTMLLTVNFGKPTAPNLAMTLDKFDSKNKVDLLLATLNIFSLWLVGVMAAGLARLSGTRFSRALLLVAAYWLALQTLLVLIGGWLGSLAPGG